MTPNPTTPPAAPVERLLATFREFAAKEASGGALLIVAALVALLLANSPLAAWYEGLWSTPLVAIPAGLTLPASLHDWINDGLMALFFLVVGLEIKRELLVGELAAPRQAVLPIVAAVGGAILPAILFLGIVGGDPQAARGWGVPMATDIAFALGVLALLGRRVPVGLRIFLAALAIVDDLLAVLVIAIFYPADLSPFAIGAALVVVAALVVANRAGVRRIGVFALLGVGLWLAVLHSGVHPTVAGVMLAMTIPMRQSVHLEQALHPWVAFVIVPLFALANAGVALGVDLAATLSEPIVLGLVVGLVVGKQAGITLAAWLVVRAGLGVLPDGVGWRQVYGAAWLGGIGFTMSLFIADLAYGATPALALAKTGILLASVIAGAGGLLFLGLVTHPPAGDSRTALDRT